jgi:proteasome accessory factor B
VAVSLERVSRRRLERLLNLTMCLMATSRFLSVAEIGEMVDGYDPGTTDDTGDAFRRMFERDKQYLRDLGVPLETGTDSSWTDEVGYRIRPGDYALPDITLAPDEAAALGLAAELWSGASLAAASASAVRKLAAAGARTLPGPDGLQPRVETTEPAFAPCLAAVRTGQAIRFPYQKLDDPAPVERHVEPWGVVSWRGRWYLVGHDRDRGAERVFRLSRMAGEVRAVGRPGVARVPEGLDLRELVSRSVPPDRDRKALLLVRPGTGHLLRRNGRPAAPERRPISGPGANMPDADLIEIDYHDTERMARWIVGHGADVIVAWPGDLRAEVIRRLTETVRGHGAARRDGDETVRAS